MILYLVKSLEPCECDTLCRCSQPSLVDIYLDKKAADKRCSEVHSGSIEMYDLKIDGPSPEELVEEFNGMVRDGNHSVNAFLLAQNSLEIALDSLGYSDALAQYHQLMHHVNISVTERK